MTVRITNNLGQFVQRIEDKAHVGMAQALILGASEAAALTPRSSSVLINSQFRRVSNEGWKVVGRVGYTANYALAVHEAEGKLKGTNTPRPKENGISRGNVWDPSGEPEFLKKGFERAEPNIRKALKGALK
jgi:hypothetical protein